MQVRRRQHFDQRVNTEQIDLAAHHPTASNAASTRTSNARNGRSGCPPAMSLAHESMASLPTKLTAPDLLTIAVAGRYFRSREGRSQFRGTVRGTRLDDERITISVGSVERQQGSAWAPFPDFDYQGKVDLTGIWRETDGRISIDIVQMARITIYPPAE